jgi:hypothetical protein
MLQEGLDREEYQGLIHDHVEKFSERRLESRIPAQIPVGKRESEEGG